MWNNVHEVNFNCFYKDFSCITPFTIRCGAAEMLFGASNVF